MAYSETAKRAAIKYMAKAYDRIYLKVQRGKKELLRAAAESEGLSLNAYIVGLLEEDLKKRGL